MIWRAEAASLTEDALEGRSVFIHIRLELPVDKSWMDMRRAHNHAGSRRFADVLSKGLVIACFDMRGSKDFGFGVASSSSKRITARVTGRIQDDCVIDAIDQRRFIHIRLELPVDKSWMDMRRAHNHAVSRRFAEFLISRGDKSFDTCG